MNNNINNNKFINNFNNFNIIFNNNIDNIKLIIDEFKGFITNNNIFDFFEFNQSEIEFFENLLYVDYDLLTNKENIKEEKHFQ